MKDLTQATATELSSLYQSGAASPVTVAEQVLAKIERLNPVINAFCFTDPDTTLAQARASEQRWKNGQPLGALDGVPISVKDSICVDGWPTLHGSRAVDIKQLWNLDNPEIKRLRTAGMVFVGKTTVPEFNLRQDTFSILNGTTKNPWNLNYSPGGSSGGSASAVSSGLGPISIGSDLGGSIILPAAFCGVVGFKPTGKSGTGPLAREVSDIQLIMKSNSSNYDMKNLKIGYLRNEYLNEILEYTDAAIESLKLQGFKIQIIDLEIDFIAVQKLFVRYCQPTFNTIYDQLTVEQQHLLENSTRQQLSRHEEYSTIIKGLIKKIAERILRKTNECDIFLMSSTHVTAFKTNDLPPMHYLMEKHKDKQLLWSNSFICNVTQQPTISIPICNADNGLPVGIQIVGTVGCDDLVLQFAKTIEPLFPKLHSPLM